MKKLLSVILILATLTLCLAACGGSGTMKRGTVTDNVYRNDALDLTFTLSDGWRFYTDEEIAKTMNIAADLYKDENILKSAEITTVIDFMAVDAKTGNNVNLSVENLVPSKNTRISVDEYIEITKKNLNEQMQGMTYTFTEAEEAKLGDTEYTKLSARCSYSGISMMQSIYLKKVGNSMVSITVTSVNGASVTTFEDMFS